MPRRPRHAKLENDMPDWRPIEDRHAPLATDIPHRRLTCPIGDPSETNMSVSDEACRGFLWVADSNNIFVNSLKDKNRAYKENS